MNHEPTIFTIRELAETLGINSSPQERMTLIVLAAEDGGMVKMGDLARRVGTTPGGMALIVDRLILAGMVERLRDAPGTDRRFVYARSTKQGNKAVARAEARASDIAA